MEPPAAAPPLSATTAAAPSQAHLPYPDSVDSSPRSRNADSWDDFYQTVSGTSPKLRLMCSYGGHIVPRPHDKSLCYVGGDTRIIVVDRLSSLSDLTHRLSKTLFQGKTFTFKYQLPNEDLDSLISVTTDEDLENMIDEYDRLSSNSTTNSNKSSRLRIFLFPSKPESASSIGSLLENSIKSEDWFLDALNGTTSELSDSNSVNCLLGLDDDVITSNNQNNLVNNDVNFKGVSRSISKNSGGAQDVHSVPDSPMLDTTSSFGSASSSPSLANLPPIRVHMVEDQQKVGIEEQFSQMGVSGNVQQKSDDGGVVVLSSPPPALAATAGMMAASGPPMSSAPVIGEYSNRVFSDDDRSEQGVSMGYRKQLQQQTQFVPSQFQQKPTGGVDFPSPDSVSSDGSITDPLSRQKPMMYQEPIVQIQPGQNRVSANPVEPKASDPNARIMIQQQFQDSGYLLPTQYDPQLHPQLYQQQPQFIHAGTQYIPHHPTGAVPMASYYPIYPPQQQHHPHHAALDQQYPVYYVPARQGQPYNMAVQQSGYSQAAVSTPPSHPQTPPATAYNTATNAPAPKPDTAAGVYRTATAAAPSLVQVSSSQHQPQYVGFSQLQHHPSQSTAPTSQIHQPSQSIAPTSQIHHPSQSVAPASAAMANYGFEFTDPTQGHMYYTQPLPPQMSAQYQTMTSEATAHIPTDSISKFELHSRDR